MQRIKNNCHKGAKAQRNNTKRINNRRDAEKQRKNTKRINNRRDAEKQRKKSKMHEYFNYLFHKVINLYIINHYTVVNCKYRAFQYIISNY